MLRQASSALRTARIPLLGLPSGSAHPRINPRAHLNLQLASRWVSTRKPRQPSNSKPPSQLSEALHPRRAFATTPSRLARNTYNRFNSSHSARPSIFHTLLSRSKPHHFVLIGLGISGIYLYNTEVVEMTGRRRFNCVSHEAELKMGMQSYREVLAQSQGRILPDNHPVAQMVNRVLQRLIPQAPIEGADWRVHVILDDENANAFVLPG